MSTYKSEAFGTINYLAPETYLDFDGKYTANSADMWSLGVIIFEMIYKRLPFSVDSTKKIDSKEIESFFKGEQEIIYPKIDNKPA